MTFNFDLKRELDGLEGRKTSAALELAKIEEQIWLLEVNYLKDTKLSGNISLGYESYRGQTKKPSGAVVRRDKGMKKLEKDGRIFSNSSVSSRNATKGTQKHGLQSLPKAVATRNSGSKKVGVKSSQVKAPSVKTSMVQGLRGKKVFVRSRSKSKCRYIATSGARRVNPVTLLQQKSPNTFGQLTSLSWIQLRQECLKAGVHANGKKSEMIARLTSCEKAV